jgi:formate hydrogenlyase subunit 3/multisubunit Na+/H+ antiporter MnhD subunit
MTEIGTLTAIRALFPVLAALSSLALVPLIRLWRGSERDDAATYATFGVQLLLLATSVGAALAGAGYLSTLKVGQITIDPSEPGRLLVLLGGIVFAVIVGAGEGRRAGTMGQIALFGIAAIDLALAIPSGIAPIALLLFASLGISGTAASGKDDVGRARAVFRDLRTVSLLLPAVVIAEILRVAISYAAVDASYATPASLAAGTALGVSIVLIVAAGVFPFHGRLIKIFEALPIVGSLLVGVWIPSALALIVMSELSALASSITDPLGGAIVPGILLAGAATLIFGAVSALLHDDIGEIVGFMAVANSGWLALAAAAALQSPTDTSSRLIVLPGMLTISLFGLWLVSVRRRYGTTSIRELGGWARRTSANGIALTAAIVALAALPPGAVLAARLNLLLLGGNPLIALFAVIGQVLLIVAAIRLLLIGFTPQSQTVHEAETRPFANLITMSLVAGSLFVAAAAAGWLALESGGTGPLPPAPSVSPATSFAPVPSSEPSVEPTPSLTASPEVLPEVSPDGSPSGSGEISPAP